MDPLAQIIENAERENRRDRHKDSLTLVCTVLVAQHQAIVGQAAKLKLLEERLAKLERDHPSW